MTEYGPDFTLIVENIGDDIEFAENLYALGRDDASVGSVEGVTLVEFMSDRARPFLESILDAIESVYDF